MWKKLVDIAVVGTFLLTFVLVIQNWQHPFQSFSISRDKLQILSVIAMLAAAGLNYSAYGSRFHKQVSQATSLHYS